MEGQQFAKRMDSLFIEASAKLSLNVNEAFQELVENILDTPELWETKGGGQQVTANGRGGMPGGVQVVGLNQSQTLGGGCSC